MGSTPPRILALFVALTPVAGCLRAPEPPARPTEPSEDDRGSIDAAARNLEAGLEVLRTYGPPAKAKEHADAGLAELRKAQVVGSYRAAQLYDLLGRANHALGAHEAARIAFQQEIEILRDSNGRPSEIARALTALGESFSAEGKYDSAEPSLVEALSTHRTETPLDAAGYADSVIALATVYTRTKRAGDAKRLVATVMPDPKAASGLEDIRFFRLQMILADIARDEGKLEDAIEPLVQAAATARRHEPSLAPQGVEALDRLSDTYWELGRCESAVAAAESALSVAERNPGADLLGARFLSRLIEWYKTLGRADDAQRIRTVFHLVVRSLVPGQKEPVDGEPKNVQWGVPASTPKTKAATPAIGNVSNAARIVASMRAAFRACYQSALDDDAELEGSVTLAILVGANGSIAAVVGRTTNLPTETVDCVLTHAIEKRFDPPEGGKAVVNVPVNFKRL